MTRTIEEQTGWVGALPETICQDFDTLLKITEYDYSLESSDFIDYCVERGSWNRVPETKSLYQFAQHHSWSKRAFFQALGGPHTDNGELTLMWRGIQAARGALQDCWEIYTLRRI
jgi:hypothetical protein